MDLQIQPNRWSCIATAAAMLADVSVEAFIKKIGHDGSEIIWPDQREPLRRRGFHIREIIDVLDDYGILICPIDAMPLTTYYGCKDDSDFRINIPIERFIKHLQFPGILTGFAKSETPHAVAWDGQRIYDPKGDIYQIDCFKIQTLWRTIQANSRY